MKRYWLIVYSFIILVLLAIFIPKEILMNPQVTGVEYLASIPYMQVGSYILIKPTSSFIVYALGIVIIIIGGVFLNRKGTSRTLWAIALILWGVGTILAGTSYQAFGYELKCVGQSYCSFTSWWELAYLYITGLSIGFMTASVLYYTYELKYVAFPIYGSAVYGIILVIGSMMQSYLLITYEFFLFYFLWFFITMLVVNVKEYRKTKEIYHYKLIRTWVGMLFVNIIYFAYLFSGIPEWLWIRGIWFSANDVLHIGVLIWFIKIWLNLGNEMLE